jgi:Right handed beta helix region
MMNTQTTTKTNHYFRTMTALVVLAMVAAMLLTATPSYASTTFTVVNTNDSGTGSLEQVILDANANANPTEVDRIDFDIPGTGVKTISPNSALPIITEPVVIDGYSQHGSSVNTLARGTNAKLLVQIDGTASAGGLTVQASHSVVKGLVLNRFSSGVALDISPERSAEVVTHVRIEGNFIGTDPSGTLDRGNAGGVDLFAASNNTIGGTSRAARNLISGNDRNGVQILGGATFGRGRSDHNVVRGNLLGTQRDGLKPLGNDVNGVGIFGDDADGNNILSNSIFSNGGPGIDLGEDGTTANDPGDADTGPNDLQNKPSLASARNASGKTSVKGTLDGRPGATYTVQFFSNPPGTDEGQTFLGQKTGLAVDGSGKGTFTFSPSSKVAVGRTITATATDESTGDTSEFSAPRKVAA